MTAIYYPSDANQNVLTPHTIAVLGYGNLGRSLALNLRDAGLNVLIGNEEDTYAQTARTDGFEVLTMREAATQATIKWMLVSDEVMPEVYLEHVSPTLKKGDLVLFAAGYNVSFGFIEPPPFVDVGMIAPRTTWIGVREHFLEQDGFQSFVSIFQDASKTAWDKLLAVALVIGALRGGALEITFRQEAELDLFVQHSLLPVIHNTITAAADLLIKEGYPPEAVILDLFASGELGYVFSKAAQSGLLGSLNLFSQMGQYSILSRAEILQDPKLRRQMEQALDDIRTGKFAKEWASEHANGHLRLDALRRRRGLQNFATQERQALKSLGRTPPEDIAGRPEL